MNVFMPCESVLANVYDLFKQKLINKWKADAEKGRPSKWTNRGMPEWAKGEIKP